MTDKTKSRLIALCFLVRVVLYGVMLRFIYQETGVWTVINFSLGMATVEAVGFLIGLHRKMIDQSNERFAAILLVIEGIVREITEMKKARIDSSMTITSGTAEPIDPADPLAKNQGVV